MDNKDLFYDKKDVLKNEEKILVKNTFFSFLNKYSFYFLTMITSFLTAKIISMDLWGYLILALSYIAIASTILSFFPPALSYSINYYVPRFIALNQKTELKNFIKNAFFIKILFTIPAFIICFLIFYFLNPLIAINLKNYTNLIFLLTPLIFINSISVIPISIYRSFNKFNILFILTLIKFISNIIALTYCFLFIELVKIEIVALINLASSLIQIIVSLIIFFNLYSKISVNQRVKFSIKSDFYKITKYGTPISLSAILNTIWIEFQYQIIGIYESSSIVTGFNISRHYSEVSLISSASFSDPLLTSFTSLDAKKDHEQINKIFNLSLKYSLFLLLFITGTLFFISDFYLFLVYGESYLIFSIIIKIILLSFIFSVIGNIYVSLINSINKVNILPVILFVNLSIQIPFFLIGLIYFGIIYGIVFLTIGRFFGMIIQIIVSIKVGKVKLNFEKIILSYLIFLISLGVSYVLNYLFVKDFWKIFTVKFNFVIFQNLDFLPLVLFWIIFLLLTIVFKIFTKRDINSLEGLFEKNKRLNNFIKKQLRILKKIVKD